MTLGVPVVLRVDDDSALTVVFAGVVLVAAIALVLTIAGHGPIHLILSGSATQSAVLQLFLAVSTFVALPVAAFQRQRRAIITELVETSAAAERSEASSAFWPRAPWTSSPTATCTGR